ncbi:efflux ABC transporter [Baffinella frigidus]|nr:efflux ABC transporter [Cryptophyta sp. CCMP2293]
MSQKEDDAAPMLAGNEKAAKPSASSIKDADKAEPKRPVDVKRLLKLAWPERWLLCAATVGLVVSSATGLLVIAVVGEMVDIIVSQDQEGRARLSSSLAKLIVVFCFGGVMTFVRASLYSIAGERVVKRLRVDLFSAIIEFEVAFFDSHRTGEILSRLSDDCTVIQSTVTSNISVGLRNVLQIMGCLTIMLATSWRLTLVMLSVVPVLAIGAVRYGKFVKEISKKVQDALAEAAAEAEQNISNLRTVRSFCGEADARDKYAALLQESFLLAKNRAIAYGAFSGGGYIIGNFALVMVLFYGGTLVLDGDLSVGELTSFILYTLGIGGALAMLTSAFNDFAKALGSSQRVFDLIDREPPIKLYGIGGTRDAPFSRGGPAEANTPFVASISIQDVHFNYPSRADVKVLRGLTLSIAPGSTVALVGPSGGGKSTVVSMIKRFYDPLTGRVMISGLDVRELSRDYFMRNIASVMQEPVLFARSIRENILVGVDLSTAGSNDLSPAEIDAKVIAAAKSANAWDFIQSFEEGLDTAVGERGVRLSGGQKQRIAIARALVKDPKILLLDEATSALDAESEGLVQAAIDKLLASHCRTTVVVAHRLSTIRNADTIAVIVNGGVVQQGPHAELLLDKAGTYAKLVSKQMSGHSPLDICPTLEEPPQGSAAIEGEGSA